MSVTLCIFIFFQLEQLSCLWSTKIKMFCCPFVSVYIPYLLYFLQCTDFEPRDLLMLAKHFELHPQSQHLHSHKTYFWLLKMLFSLLAFTVTVLGMFEIFRTLSSSFNTKKEVRCKSMFIKIAWVLEFIPRHKAFLDELDQCLIETQPFQYRCS